MLDAPVTEEQRRAVARAAFGTCVCAGWCGRKHRGPMEWGRCSAKEADAPLEAIPVELTPSHGDPGDRVAMCRRCAGDLRRLLALPPAITASSDVQLGLFPDGAL